MIKNFLLLFGICFGLVSFSIPEKIEKKADKVISKFLDTENFQKENIAISEALDRKTASEFKNGNLFSIISKGKKIGYGYIGNASSKTATFDYLVLFDINFIITKSKVLVYREEYGGEIGSKRWLQQFEGKSSKSSELKYNQEIIPISGATISVRSMTKAMNNLLQSIAILQKEKAI